MQTIQRRTRIAPNHGSAGSLFAAAIQLLLNWQERASQRRHLDSLGDRALKDIGLSRADVAGESAKPFWRS